MAFHCSVVALSRSAGRSAAGACAYIAAEVAEDAYTGERLDYRRKAKPRAVGFSGTEHKTAATFAHALDSGEKRKNSTVAREVILALPASLSPAENAALTAGFSDWLSASYGVPAMWATHKPDRKGDQRNEHAHIVLGTRDGSGHKVRALDDLKQGPEEVSRIRRELSRRISAAVPAAELAAWDCRSLAERGLWAAPTRHEGPAATRLKRAGELAPVARENAERHAANRSAATTSKLAAAAEREANAATADAAKERAKDAPYAAWRAADDEKAAAEKAAADARAEAAAELPREPKPSEAARERAAERAAAEARAANAARSPWQKLARKGYRAPEAAAEAARKRFDEAVKAAWAARDAATTQRGKAEQRASWAGEKAQRADRRRSEAARETPVYREWQARAALSDAERAREARETAELISQAEQARKRRANERFAAEQQRLNRAYNNASITTRIKMQQVPAYRLGVSVAPVKVQAQKYEAKQFAIKQQQKQQPQQRGPSL